MKHVIYSAVALVTLSFAACDQPSGGGQTEVSNNANEVTSIAEIPAVGDGAKTEALPNSAPAITVTVKGGIDPQNWKPGETATLTFNRFPRNAAEWQAVQEQYGNRPEAAVLLELMAFEIYNHDKDF